VRHRYIGGFGAIHWLDQVTLANPFAGKAEASMVEHMNSDHANAIAHYVALTDLPARRGADGRHRQRRHAPAHRPGGALAAFPTTCNTPTQVREALVLLARADQWPLWRKRGLKKKRTHPSEVLQEGYLPSRNP
jgi:putative heme iron utilization protein